MRTLTIHVPDDLGTKDTQQLEALAREALLVKLYKQGEISSGYAAEILGLSRRTFLDLLGDYGVSIFDPATDIAAEASHD